MFAPEPVAKVIVIDDPIKPDNSNYKKEEAKEYFESVVKNRVLNSYPIYITVKSDGNILQLVGNKNKILTYKYVKSETKLNSLVTFTEELLEKFIETNK